MLQKSRAVSGLLAVGLLIGALLAPQQVLAAPDWVAKSDQNAQLFIDVLAHFNPEAAGQFGVDGLDEAILQIPADRPEQQLEAIEKALMQLRTRLKKETHPAIRQDLEIMIEAAEQGIEGIHLNRAQLIPYFDLPQTIFQDAVIVESYGRSTNSFFPSFKACS